MSFLTRTDLRARFAEQLSALYAREVPAYSTLVEVAHEVNARYAQRLGDTAERLGSIERVTAERHGAIRVGSPKELAQVAQIFAALGMQPTGFYDLRDARPRPIPVVSTAFRPLDPGELALNPFRMFTSMLVPQDRRFFDAETEARLIGFIDGRVLFGAELLGLATTAERDAGLPDADAKRFLDLATSAFALSTEPIDRRWYEQLDAISSVAADIGGVATTHVNHLTPRVLDIDDLYTSMTERGLEMIDAIQGPPGWEGPAVLLRQTSFRALAEPRTFRNADGTLSEGTLRVRFGEVEARGIALTPRGRDLYDQLATDLDAEAPTQPTRCRADIARELWSARFPRSEAELERRGLAFFTYHRSGTVLPASGGSGDLDALLDAGLVEARPMVYEDFLPRSAAGIFSSNLNGGTDTPVDEAGVRRDVTWLANAIGRPIHDPNQLYARESEESLRLLGAELGLAVTANRAHLRVGPTSR